MQSSISLYISNCPICGKTNKWYSGHVRGITICGQDSIAFYGACCEEHLHKESPLIHKVENNSPGYMGEYNEKLGIYGQATRIDTDGKYIRVAIPFQE